MIENLLARSPDYLGTDEIRLAHAEASGEATLTDQDLALRDTHLACDVGQVHVSGTLPTASLSAA